MANKSIFGRNKLIKIAIILIVAAISFVAGAMTYRQVENTLNNCNVAVFSVKGYLETFSPIQPSGEETDVSSAEGIVSGLLDVDKDPQIKAVMVTIDSGGGDGVAGEEIANALKSLTKPSVAVIRSMGNSAAYWAATGASKVYASKISDVGGIGVTSSYLDQTAKDAQEGYKYVELTSAKYKDLGNPSRSLTFEDKALIVADLQKAHSIFVEEVAQNRHLSVDAVKSLANGLSFIGIDALSSGLIDEIGDLTTATKYLEDKIGESVQLCWY